jgi:hypothetical protein
MTALVCSFEGLATSMTPACYVCDEVDCSSCSAGEITSCELPSRLASPGGAGKDRLLYPPQPINCRIWDDVQGTQIVEAPCNAPPPGYTLIGSNCTAFPGNCCFLLDDIYDEPDFVHHDADTPKCAGGDCTG